MTTELEQRQHIEALREWIEENRADYEQASTILRDPAQVRGFVKTIAAKVSGALRYDPYTHPPEAAVAEIARLQERLGGVLSDVEFLDEYEEKKKRYMDAIRALVGEESQDTPALPGDE